MRYQFYTLLILLLGISSCQDVGSLVSSIAKENIVECEVVGFAGTSSSIYKKFEKLKTKAGKEKLLELTNHDSLAVVGYSMYALVDKKLIAPSKLLQKFIDKEGDVSTYCGCIMGGETLSSLVYHRYWNTRVEYPDDEDYAKKVINDSEELKKMDSLILNSKNPDRVLLARAFDNRVYPDEYTTKIVEWAFDKNNFYALEYVFKNLKEVSEEKLIKSANEFLASETNHRAQKGKIRQMMRELN